MNPTAGLGSGPAPPTPRSRDGKTYSGVGFFSSCADYTNRASQIFRLNGVVLTNSGTGTSSSPSSSQLKNTCNAIDARRFYRVLNEYSTGLCKFRLENKIPLLGAPVVFDIEGRLVDEKHLDKTFKKSSRGSAKAIGKGGKNAELM
ncbi:hypothetical protein G7Y89_g6034 [Cudoniella acicularis]|uniref:Uncharacterized protein n=1 Tax=Cudoniella acicularis TaxID=354080 RepID=A0A8H4W387_9HELO|nr:hypothetical protein G7Y89_g6034 [Cudoniella acicularis]